MDKLTKAREIIDRVDREMAALFCERMKAAALVAEHKKEKGMPIFDAAREKAVIEKNASRVEEPALREFYTLFLQHTMDVSKLYQRKLLSGMRIAYAGTEGAFAHVAAMRIFPDGEKVPFVDFAAAYSSVESGDCDAAVIPIENSYAGEVAEAVDLIYFGSLRINGVYELPVVHDLLALPGAAMADIKTVISHPQALSQCAHYINEAGFAVKEFSNTALAAKHVAEAGDKSLAAIAGGETGELYGLCSLAKGINASRSNTTRFAVLSRAENDPLQGGRGDHFILLLTVKHAAGSLVRAIDILGKYGYNITTLRSRPVKELLWQYYFYIEAEGDLDTETGRAMLRELRTECEELKIAGTYRAHRILKGGSKA
ncbi:MAG: bifunctional chorismate mutase/prephenate dehydratase [Clostridiales bacterium]|nr:bifunctional chorismate mutase/prephenate dehydratase [Clostridiales bacterium]